MIGYARRTSFALTGLLACSTLALSPALAQGWVPQRHVEFVAPAAAGSSMDNVTRTVERLTRELVRPPVSSGVVNRSGGEHAVAYNFLRSRAGDPHVVGIASQIILTNNITGVLPFTYSDLTPISVLLAEHYIAVVGRDSPYKTGRELVEALQRNPEAASIAVANVTQRMAIAMVLQAARVDLKRVRMPVIAGGKMALSVAGGHVDVAISSIGQAIPLVEGGMLRVIGVSGPKRLGGIFAAVPTWEEQGYENAAFVTWRGLLAPPGISAPQVAYWESAMQKVAESEELRKVAERHQWVISYRNAADSRQYMESEYARMKQLMASLGLIK